MPILPCTHTHACAQAGALRALLDTAISAERHALGRSGPSGADGGSPVKIALFSLGNMCAHRECREALLALNIWDAIRRWGTCCGCAAQCKHALAGGLGLLAPVLAQHAQGCVGAQSADLIWLCCCSRQPRRSCVDLVVLLLKAAA